MENPKRAKLPPGIFLWKQLSELDPDHPPLRAAVAGVLPVPALISAPCLRTSLAGAEVSVTGLLNAGLFTSHGLGNVLGTLHLLLPEIHLFPNYRGLLDADLLFHKRDADLLSLVDRSAGFPPPSGGTSIVRSSLTTSLRSLTSPA